MQTSTTASLLVAALVMLCHPCPRNKATAQLLLERAAEHTELTPAEREACRNLADDLDIECPGPVLRPPAAVPAHLAAVRHRHLSLIAGQEGRDPAAIGQGEGEKAGIAYRMKDGSMVYVPETAATE